MQSNEEHAHVAAQMKSTTTSPSANQPQLSSGSPLHFSFMQPSYTGNPSPSMIHPSVSYFPYSLPVSPSSPDMVTSPYTLPAHLNVMSPAPYMHCKAVAPEPNPTSPSAQQLINNLFPSPVNPNNNIYLQQHASQPRYAPYVDPLYEQHAQQYAQWLIQQQQMQAYQRYILHHQQQMSSAPNPVSENVTNNHTTSTPHGVSLDSRLNHDINNIMERTPRKIQPHSPFPRTRTRVMTSPLSLLSSTPTSYTHHSTHTNASGDGNVEHGSTHPNSDHGLAPIRISSSPSHQYNHNIYNNTPFSPHSPLPLDQHSPSFLTPVTSRIHTLLATAMNATKLAGLFLKYITNPSSPLYVHFGVLGICGAYTLNSWLVRAILAARSSSSYTLLLRHEDKFDSVVLTNVLPRHTLTDSKRHIIMTSLLSLVPKVLKQLLVKFASMYNSAPQQFIGQNSLSLLSLAIHAAVKLLVFITCADPVLAAVPVILALWSLVVISTRLAISAYKLVRRIYSSREPKTNYSSNICNDSIKSNDNIKTNDIDITRENVLNESIYEYVQHPSPHSYAHNISFPSQNLDSSSSAKSTPDHDVNDDNNRTPMNISLILLFIYVLLLQTKANNV